MKSAPESGCIDAASLGAQVEARLGRRAFEPDARLLVRVTLAPKAPRGWSARLELLNTRDELFGAREIATDSEACRELDSSLALVTALLVDSPAATRAAQSETVETAPPPPTESRLQHRGPRETLEPVRRRERTLEGDAERGLRSLIRLRAASAVRAPRGPRGEAAGLHLDGGRGDRATGPARSRTTSST